MQNVKKHIATLGMILLGALWMVPQTGALDRGIEVEGIDTIAGYSALLRVSNAPSEADLEIWVEKPDGSEVVLETTSDKYGKAKVDLEGFYTKKAGDYTVKARLAQTTEEFGSESEFTVYPDTVSTSHSTVEVDRSTASANGNDYIRLEVNLKDRYKNPIEGHTLNVISSRLNDDVVRISKNPYTDPQGSMLFHIYSQESGVSTFVIHDSTSDITLDDRAKIAFYAPDSTASLSAMGGNSILLAASGTSGSVDHFKIEDLDSEVKVNQTLNFTVTAYDANDEIVPDYTGTVRFSSSDSNATLPDDYEFEAEDQGTHTFSLSLSFKSTGTHTLTVTDIDDTDLEGEWAVEVSSTGTGSSSSSGTSGSESESSTDGSFSITSPNPGTYSSQSLSFTGSGSYGETIQIYDDSTLIGSTAVKADGSFSYTATQLADGEHSFLLVSVNESGEEQDRSDTLSVTLDTTGPEIDQLSINPEGDIPAESEFTISLYTEKNLPEASVLFNNQLFDMTEDLLIDGYYQVTLNAPEALGEYEIDVILVDEIGNESSYNNAGQITVVEASASETITEEETTEEELFDSALELEDDEPWIGAVTGIEAVAGDGRVTLSWEKPTEEASSTQETTESEESDGAEATESTEAVSNSEESATSEETDVEPIDSTGIEHYRIYYGPDPELLYSTDDTWDNSTTWYVDDLENDTLYYFKIVAVNEDGEEGEVSEMISGTPKSTEAEALYNASLEEEAAAAEAEAVETAVEEEATPETGPETIWLLGLSACFGFFYFRKSPNTHSITDQKLPAFSTQIKTTGVPMIDIRPPR